MKKLLFLITAILLHLSAMAAIDPVAPTQGDGTNDNPYLIGTPSNLLWFVRQVNGGQVYLCGRLTADIDFSETKEMIAGSGGDNYKGTFDGDGHTVTINYNNDIFTSSVALFCYVQDATIKNLRTAGIITTYGSTSAGIVANCTGSTYIENCSSSVTINSTYTVKQSGSHGGIVAHNYQRVYLTNVLFDGKLLGENATECGGLVGYSSGRVVITGCWFNPTQVTVNTEGAKTLSRGDNVTVNNSYYSVALGETQGTATTAEALTSGEMCYNLNAGKTDGSQVWYQNIDNGKTTDAAPVRDKTHGTVYSGVEQCPSTGYSNQQKAHTLGGFDSDGFSHCTVSGCEGIGYQPAQNVSGTYQIVNKGNLIWFANQVNAGQVNINAKLTTDIDLGNYQNMIGTHSSQYAGTFDGDGHSVTINYTATEDNTGLFRFVNGATIKNLQTTGSISTGYQYAGGIVSESYGTTNIEHCASSVAITSTFTETKDGIHGGIVGNNLAIVNLTNVLFNGKLLGNKVIRWGGLVGWSETRAYISGCLFNPSEVTFSKTDAETLSGGNSTVNNSYYSAKFGYGYKYYQGIRVTEDALASGEVCYNLNAGKTDGTQAWYQNINNDKAKDAEPVFDKTHGTVYSGADYCPGSSFSNTKNSHTYTIADGVKVCTVCHYEAEYTEPETDASGTYLIANKGNLIWFAQHSSNTSINGKLTANIDLGNNQAMVGSSDFYYGTFDGDGHSVTVNYTATDNATALFRYVKDATIRNLNTSGSITTGHSFAGGIVAVSAGTTTIENCASNVTITSTFTERTDGTHGGIVGNNTHIINLTNVLFNGKLLGKYAYDCGGLVGWSQIGANINGCWFNPTEVTFHTDGAMTMSRGNDVTVNNSYYSVAFGEEPQGIATPTGAPASGELCYALNAGKTNGSQGWYQNLDNGKAQDSAPVLRQSSAQDNTHGTVYGGEDQCPGGSFSNTAKPHTFTIADGVKFCTTCHYEAEHSEPGKDASGTYLIANKGNFVWFAQHVNSGNTNINGKLTANIDLGDNQTMVGTSTNEYSGTFNGDGHSVTVNYTAKEDFTALFRYVKDATISKLMTAGSISTGYQYAGGIVAENHGTTSIENCASSVAITSTFTVAKYASHGGIVADDVATLSLTNVVFNGKLLGENAKGCGGLIGWSQTRPTITNCIFSPAEVKVSSVDASTLARNNEITVNNCYYSVCLGNAQGTATKPEAVTSGELCYTLNAGNTDGSQVWYQNLDNEQDIDATPMPFNTHGIVYGGEDQCPIGSFSNTAKPHTLTIADGVKVCTVCHYEAEYIEPGKDASGTYLIANKGNFIWFAQQVNSGNTNINGKLTANIDLGDNQTMVGTFTNWYSGAFDGDGHSISVNYTATEDYTALFRNVKNATITNLLTLGSITTGYSYAGGIVAVSDGTTYINNSASSVTITSTFTVAKYASHGGIVANNWMSTGYDDMVTLHLTNVLFNGKLLGENATSCGGLVGKSNVNSIITRCLFAPSQVTFSSSDAWTLGEGIRANNCYYSVAFGQAQGTAATTDALTSGELCYILNAGNTDGSQAWYQNIDNNKTIDAIPVPFNTHGIVYGGEDQCPVGLFSNTSKPHTLVSGYVNGVGYCAVETCHHEMYETPKTDASGTYLIANKGNLAWFAQHVNKGNTEVNGKLTANIDLGNIQAMIGTNKYKYAGTFDGDGYTVTVNYTAAEDVTALFRYVQNGTIKNLMTAGTINTAKRNAAGVAGMCYGVTLDKVISSVVINSTYKGDGTHAGLVAEARSVNSNETTSSLTDCAFIGQLLGSETTNCAGLVGHHDDGVLTLTNCYVAPSAAYTISSTGSMTLVRNGNPTITNCYYTKTLTEGQGRWRSEDQVAKGDLIEDLGSSVWIQDPLLNKPVPFFLKSILSKYLKFTAQGDGTITVNKNGTVAATLEYFTEETKQWTDLAYNSPISLSEGKSIWMRAKGTDGKNEYLSTGYHNYLNFTSTMDVAASQNIMSLLDASCEQTEVPSFAFNTMFSGWKHLTQAPELPGTMLNTDCYGYMFEGCTGLTSIPDLSNASLAYNAQRACEYMFSGCSNVKVNTLGLGSEWKIQMEGATNNLNSMFSGTGGNFTSDPQKDVTYYIYNDEPYTRQMANTWGTVVLPFDVAYDTENTNHKFYHLTAADSEYLTLAEYETSTIPAGTPMVVKAIGAKGGDDKYTISIPSAKGSFSGIIKAQNTENADLPEGWTMKGTYSDLTNQTGMFYIAKDKFWKADSPINIASFRGWFECSTAGSAKSFRIILTDEDVATQIHETENGELRMKNGKYIENRRVVIIRNGKKYNLNGQEVF